MRFLENFRKSPRQPAGGHPVEKRPSGRVLLLPAPGLAPVVGAVAAFVVLALPLAAPGLRRLGGGELGLPLGGGLLVGLQDRQRSPLPMHMSDASSDRV